MKTYLNILSLSIITLLSACAFGTRMSFENTSLLLPPTAEQIQVAVWDARPYVLSGDKTPSWVGLQRSGWGIPYGVHTQSGAPLAAEFAKAISGGFTKNGVSSSIVTLPATAKDKATVLASLPTNGKVLLLELNDWKTDTLTDINFDYDLRLNVLNNGKVITTESTKGNEKLDGSFWNPIGSSDRVAVAKQKEKLDALFSLQTVKNAVAKK